MSLSSQPYVDFARELERLRLHLTGSNQSLDRDKQDLNRNIVEFRKLMQQWDRSLSSRCSEMDRRIGEMQRAIQSLTTKNYD